MESNILVLNGETNVEFEMFVSKRENAVIGGSTVEPTNVSSTLTKKRISDNVSNIFLDTKKCIAPLDNLAIKLHQKKYAIEPV
jgi:hypothetical protein